MDEVPSESLGDTRFYMQLLSIVVVVAVFLAVIGIYGVMSYLVSSTHDIGDPHGIRGAHHSNIVSWIAKLGMKLVSIGIAVGIALALGLTRLISSALFGITPTDPTTYLAVALGLAAVALLACYIPAHRATKVDPMVALRYE